MSGQNANLGTIFGRHVEDSEVVLFGNSSWMVDETSGFVNAKYNKQNVMLKNYSKMLQLTRFNQYPAQFEMQFILISEK